MGSAMDASGLHREDPKVQEHVEVAVTYACDYLNKIHSSGMWFGDNPLDFSLPSLLLQLCLISIITRSIYIILRPFGQPLIVSQILGGVIIGPSILGRNRTFSTKVFSIRSRTVIETVSLFGLMIFIFLIGVKMDTTMILRSGKKAFAIGILGFFIPYGLTSFAAFLFNHFLSLDHDISTILPSVVSLQSITAFPVIACFLSEHKLLNSEIGRLASSSSIVSDVCHLSIMLLKYTTKLAMAKSFKLSIGPLLSSALFIVLLVFGVRPAALWAIRNTPEGKPVKDVYIFAAIFTLMCGGLVGELIGVSSIVASLAIGLVIPDGPPLGAALVERLDCFVSVLLMPLFFTMCGLQMDVFSITKLKNVGVMQLIVLVAFIGKTVGTILPPLFCRMPFRDALSLALIMNTKGVVELAFLHEWKQNKVMNAECFAIMIILVVVVTGIISPIVKILYDPSRRFLAYKRRTILHSRCNDELRVLACLHNQENAKAIMTLLQVSNPTKESPIELVVLHLVKLMGRDSSLLIAHREREKSSSRPSQSERIFNAFKKFEQHNGLIMVQCYKGISPYATMHNDVCSLAMEKRTILIIVPFHKQYWAFGEMLETSHAFKNLNRNVLNKAPCSVGILIDRGDKGKLQYVITEPSLYQVAVFFFGGADDREALAYARRMSEHHSVTLNLIRFTPSNLPEVVGGTERGKMLDADILSNFKLKTLCSERVSYREEVVGSGMDVLSVTRSIAQAYDLVMVGRHHGESQIMSQLAKWNRCGELGAVGEILAASDLKGGPSVLVVQQQTRLWGLQDPEESTHLRKISL